MKRYGNRSGNSGVVAYEAGPDRIVLRFAGREGSYTYSHRGAGQVHVERMKRLAQAGQGLSTYVSRYTRDLYDRD